MLLNSPNNYIWDFVVRDIKVAAYLESPQQINFNIVSDFLSKSNFLKFYFFITEN